MSKPASVSVLHKLHAIQAGCTSLKPIYLSNYVPGDECGTQSGYRVWRRHGGFRSQITASCASTGAASISKGIFKLPRFYNYVVVFTVVVTRTKLIDLSPCQTDRPFSVHTNRDTLIEPYTALTEPRFLFYFNLSCYDGDCVWETWTWWEQIPVKGRLEYIFGRSKYLRLEIGLVM